MSTALKSPPKFQVIKGVGRKSHRTLIYGVGGIGKSSLAASVSGALFIDLEGGAVDLGVNRIDGINNWKSLREVLASDLFDDVKCIVIDSLSKAEEFARQHVIDTIPADKSGTKATSIESYGYGKGYVHLAETWRLLVADIERHYQAGRDIVLIAHDFIGKTPNPSGEDYIRHEPSLHVAIRGMTTQWCDHVLFINYDVTADKDGKATGGGSRAIYTCENATHVAKSRTLPTKHFIFEKGDKSIWAAMRSQASSSANEAPEL